MAKKFLTGVETTTLKVTGGTPSSGKVLTSDSSGTATWQTAAGGGTPGGSDTQLQFNSSGSFAGDAHLTYDGTTVRLPSITIDDSWTLPTADGTGGFYITTDGMGTASWTQLPETDWGEIGGSISSQTDLQSALDTKENVSDMVVDVPANETDPIFTASEAFNIVSGDITNLSNLSGTNTGDQDLSTYATKTGTETITHKDLTSGTNTFPTFNQDTTGKSAKTDAINSATTSVNVSAATAPSTGQVLTATDSTHATWQPASGGGGTTWNVVTGTTQTAAVNNAYFANNASLVTVTLPSTAAVGSTISVAYMGAGGWKLAQPASTVVQFGNTTTTSGTGGYLQSTAAGDVITLVCNTANTNWTVTNAMGNITVV